jgi:hypothetical protein
MNKNRMKTSVNTGEVSLPPAQSAGSGRKMGKDEANVTKKLLLRTAKWLAPPSDGRKIATTTEKTQYDPMDNNSNGKSRTKCFANSPAGKGLPTPMAFTVLKIPGSNALYVQMVNRILNGSGRCMNERANAILHY